MSVIKELDPLPKNSKLSQTINGHAQERALPKQKRPFVLTDTAS
jgi:hypothetical protein